MTKKQRAETVLRELEKLYPEVPIPLNHKDPFTLLVAVALSAQTTDKKVNQITPKLFEKADTPEKMAKLEFEEIRELIKEIGLTNQKAKNLKSMSEILVEKHAGIVPQTFEELEELPGVGHKTASVVMSQAFGFPAFPVDTHIHRLMKQWKLTEGKNVAETEKDAKKLFPESTWNKVHLQIIFYGREYSPARGSREKDFLTKMVLGN
ncbi:endonuclease III [Chryseobacterium koreense]|uniref:Endonuclease III n=1 Tax=Chryseobacterium koreense CCUG 49689 TaxID=1304281 RepID=A0A0J7IZ79_9FLAO|nr:endonuclease III [Chryseobacterium koreense]KMQ71322.1 endonuclease III [Chryseobacterium koreense CCUG 49689]MBB5333928.1 endonuclease-3 [Chryseobacterium koreense]